MSIDDSRSGIALEFGFKGDRDYIQGPDIFIATRDHPKLGRECGIVTLVCHAFLRGDGEAVPIAHDAADEFAAVFHLGPRPSSQCYGIRHAGPPSKSPRPFPEAEIVDCCELTVTGAALSAPTQFDPIEEAVAAIKAWHLKFKPIDGKWVFARIDCTTAKPLPGQRDGPITCRFLRAMGPHITRTQVECDGTQSVITFGAVL